ncbi:acyl-CoA thioester hydrolase [Parapedobacter luteus]|uniref:Acyl-CoA thioester hydrolase n=1 Tax=Parapedobacter luteus TaxID=623280 RepID=A0A1T5AY68_9SPHI|nr:acyl-CoA thioesterase [Parapedobacter luteus]SKB40001.1 acyl-CoA thioester hydrolase [Parapedobacter luteus]
MKKNVFYEGQVIWAQIDANRHLRHSAYADFCAQARSNMLEKIGLSLSRIAEDGIGPVLFREELVYLREIHLNDAVAVTVEMTKYNAANSRFSFRHEIYRSDGTKCAVVTVDGAWMDLFKRKLTVLPSEWQALVVQLPKSDDYQDVSA